MSAEAIRAYVVTLRDGRGLSQQQMADRAVIPMRTYTAWERGETQDLKAPQLLRLIRALQGSFAQLEELEGATAARGEELATSWLRSDQDVRINAILEGSTDQELTAILAAVREELASDRSLRSALRAFLAGWHARGAATDDIPQP